MRPASAQVLGACARARARRTRRTMTASEPTISDQCVVGPWPEGFVDDDLASARRFAAYVGDVTLATSQGGWHLYEHGRWRRVERVVLERLAIAWADGERAAARTDAHRVWANKLGNSHRRTNAVRDAAALLQTDVAWDANPWLLNVANGTIDLRTGQLSPHDPADRLTMQSPVAWDPTASSPVLDRFLGGATGGDDELASYLQRAVGMSLIGQIIDEVFFIVHGPGRTGKTTLLEAVGDALGGYAESVPMATLTAATKEGPSPEVAALRSKRLVKASELSRGAVLAADRVKILTGGDTISARALYQAPVQFRPTMTIWLATNRLPGVAGDDDALWARVRVVPFTTVADIPDPTVKHHLTDLRSGGPAVLRWAVEGCLDFQAHGLGTCAAVERATLAYRTSNDPVTPVREFVRQRCEHRPGAITPVAALYASYTEWCERSGIDRVTTTAFGQHMSALGIPEHRTKTTRNRRDIALRPACREAGGG